MSDAEIGKDELTYLYQIFDILSTAKEKENISEKTADYLQCIEATKGGPKEKRLAAQIICRFYKHFPTLQTQALDAVIDLCEDPDSITRIHAIRQLPGLTKENKSTITNIASILSQLLQLEDEDYTAACKSLIQVFQEDPVNAAKGILSNISLSEDSLREKIITFLFNKLLVNISKKTPELVDLLIEASKKIVPISSSNEFVAIMPFLASTKLGKTNAGQQELTDLVAKKVELDEPFNPTEEGTNNTDRLIFCVDCVLPLFNANVESTKFVVYYCMQVLPRWTEINTLKLAEEYQLSLLRQIALLCNHCGEIENITEVVFNVFERLKEDMPLPPEDMDVSKIPQMDFTRIECLLYVFHKLARKCPEFLTNDSDRLKDFRARLQFMARAVQGCKKGLNTIKSKDIDPAAKKKAELAPAVLDNINTIIKDLFYQPPLYKSNINLSFKNQPRLKVTHNNVVRNEGASPPKRKPITFESNGSTAQKQSRQNKPTEERKLYAPPSGKFSSNFGSRGSSRGNWSRGSGNRGRGRGFRGGWRN